MPALTPPWASAAGGGGASGSAAPAKLGEGEGGGASSKPPAPPAAPAPLPYGKAIVIDGDADFQKKTKADLDAIAATPSGKKLLDDIDASGKTVTIKPTTGGNSVTGFTNDALVNGGKPGAGSNSTVNFNPDRTSIGSETWETRPPAIGLAHELVHAQHAAEGSIDVTQVANDSKPDPANPKAIAQEMLEEVRTAGIPPNNTGSYTENTIRSEWDPPQPQRKWY